MSINPGALILLVLGFVAVVVGVKGTQSQAGELLTGRGATSGTIPYGYVAPAPTPAPMGVHGIKPGTPLQAAPPKGVQGS